MDPDATLARLRDLAKQELVTSGPDDDLEALELFLALDEWLSKGGFLPTDWAAMR